MKIHDVAQGTPQWLRLRAGIPTASELDSLVSPTLEIRKGAGPKSYLALKLAERWRGEPMQSFSGGVMEQGSILEDEAIPAFELATNLDVRRVGFITTDDGSFGCSPDGLLADGTGLEVKCPQPPNHVKWMLAGDVPPEHLLQCLGGMYVTDAASWRFVSYCRGFPMVVRTVTWPDDKAKNIVRVAVEQFVSQMQTGYAALVALNRGREPVHAPIPDPEPMNLEHIF